MQSSSLPFDEFSQTNPFDERSRSPHVDVNMDSKQLNDPSSSMPKKSWLKQFLAAKQELAMGLLTAPDSQMDSSSESHDESVVEDRLDALIEERNEASERREYHDTVTTAEELEDFGDIPFDAEVREACTPDIKCGVQMPKVEMPKVQLPKVQLPTEEDVKQEFANCQAACTPKITPPDISANCQSVCAPHMASQANKPLFERKDDGIDFIFELVESAFCGEYCETKKKDVMPPAINVEDLPMYKMTPKVAAVKDDDSVQTDAKSVTSARSNASTVRSKKSSSSRRKRSTLSDTRRRSRTSRDSRTNKKLAKSASSSIREHIETQPSDEGDKRRTSKSSSRQGPEPLKSSLRTSKLKHSKASAFEDLSVNKALTSNTTVTTAMTEATPSVSGMRELCVLSIGSGSSVSSFDNETHTGSRHTMRTIQGAIKEEVTAAPKGFVTSVGLLFSFVLSLSRNVVGTGAQPVNKAICLCASLIILLLWPEEIEKDRVHYEKKDPPKPPKQASLLHLVTKR